MTDLEAQARALNERAVSEAPPVDVVLARGRRMRLRRRSAAVALAACIAGSGVAVAALVNGGSGAGGVKTLDSAPTSVPSPPSPKAQAEHLAQDEVARMLLPPGSRQYLGATPSAVARPFNTFATPNFVDVNRIWVVDEPIAAVIAFLRTHAPVGMLAGGCCGTVKHFGVVIDTEMEFDERSVSNVEFASAGVEMNVVSRTATTSWVRADAQVVWREQRDPGERLATTDRVVTITRRPADPTAKPTRIVVTDPVAVDRLEQGFNALVGSVPGFHSCPQTPGYMLEFRTTATASPDAVVTIDCGDVGVTIGARREATLAADAYTETTVEHLFTGK